MQCRSRKENTSIRSVLLGIQITLFYYRSPEKIFSIKLKSVAQVQERLNIDQKFFLGNQTTFMYHQPPKNVSNQIKSMQFQSKNDNTSISNGFKVNIQLSCNIAHLKNIFNQPKSVQYRSSNDYIQIRSGYSDQTIFLYYRPPKKYFKST